MKNANDFWLKLDELVAACDLTVDRTRGSPHPCYPSVRYPLDYGYLSNTRSGDGEEIDIWVGSLPEKTVSAVLCTVDLKKQDAEVKLLLGCTPQEARNVLKVHNIGSQSAILMERSQPRAAPGRAGSLAAAS